MPNFVFKYILVLAFILFNNLPLFAQHIFYSLSVDEDLYHTLKVEIHVTAPGKDRLVFSMPIWIPGTYFAGHYGNNVINFKAYEEQGKSVPFEKLSTHDWEVKKGENQKIIVSYEVIASKDTFIGVPLDSTGALIQGASTWMYIRSLENCPTVVSIIPPSKWDIATALTLTDSVFQFHAQNYDELADCPIMMGCLKDTTAYIFNKPHQFYFRGEASFNLKDFILMMRKIITFQINLFGNAPYNRYVFQYILTPGFRGRGGLEHASSTSINFPAAKLSQDITSVANLSAHEFFHTWNVKSITSEKLLPLRYDREARLESLWWLEGVTSYYADLTLVRTHIWSRDYFFSLLEKEIELLRQNPDHLKTSLAEASWKIWETGYRSGGISYYNKGKLVGLLLDLMIRNVTQNQKSLDDVCRYLYQNYALKNKGFPDNELHKVIERITNKNFTPFFDRYINGTVELPYQNILKIAGLDVKLNTTLKPSIGTLRILGPQNKIYSIEPNSAAARAGLRRGDLLLIADGITISNHKDLAKIISQKTIGDNLDLTIIRNGTEIKLNVIVESHANIDCQIDTIKNPTKEQLRIQNRWLNTR